MYYTAELDQFPTLAGDDFGLRKTERRAVEDVQRLLYIERGRCRISFDGEEYSLEANDIFFIPAGHSCERYPGGNEVCDVRLICFSFRKPVGEVNSLQMRSLIAEERRSLTDEKRETPGDSISHMVYLANLNRGLNPEKVIELLDNIRAYSGEGSAIGARQASVYLSSLLLLISQNVVECLQSSGEVNLGSSNLSPVVRSAISYIIDNSSKKITLEDLAGNCYVSKQQLIRYFKSTFNMTPIAYINLYRFQQAQDLLVYSPNLSIREVAEKLGFENSHYFSRLFTRYAGTSPSVFREESAERRREDRECVGG